MCIVHISERGMRGVCFKAARLYFSLTTQFDKFVVVKSKSSVRLETKLFKIDTHHTAGVGGNNLQ